MQDLERFLSFFFSFICLLALGDIQLFEIDMFYGWVSSLTRNRRVVLLNFYKTSSTMNLVFKVWY